MRRLTHFSSPLYTSTVEETADSLVKRGFLFYESDDKKPHRDSKGNTHVFPPDRIFQLVNNTNEYLRNGGSIPLLKEHQKSFDNIQGEIAGQLEARKITEQDALENPKLKSLIGKIGVFCREIAIKTPDVIKAFKRGLAKTISPGIDMEHNLIRELSLVALPAIPQASLYSQQDFSALSFEEALAEKRDLDSERKELMDAFETFLDVIENIKEKSEDELEGKTQNEACRAVIEELMNWLEQNLLEPEEQQYSFGLPLNSFYEEEEPYYRERGIISSAILQRRQLR